MLVIVIIILLYQWLKIQCTSVVMLIINKLCSYDNISHVMLHYYKVSRTLYCKIVKSDTHVNEVSLGISKVSANTE